EKLPPQDLDAEQAVLGTPLMPGCEDSVEYILVHLLPDDFYRTAHQSIFRVYQKCREAKEPIDLVTVSARLRSAGILEEVGGGEYLSALMNETPSQALSSVRKYVGIIREKSALRRLRQVAHNTAEKARTGQNSAVELAEKLQTDLQSISKRVLAETDAPDLIGYDEIGQLVSATEWLWPGWIPSGHLSMMIGPVGAGKTWAALALGACITDCTRWPDLSPAPDEPQTVIWLDYESGQSTLYARMEQAQITAARFRGVSPLETSTELYLNDAAMPAVLRQWIEHYDSPLVIIDSLRHAFAGTNENDSRISSYMTPLAHVAAGTSAAILIIHHTTKRQDRTIDKETWMLDTESARGSSAIASLPRSIMGVEKPDAGSDVLRLRVTTSNLCETPEPVGFQIRGREDGTACVQWSESPRRPMQLTPRDRAIELLRRELQNGPQPSVDLIEKGKEQGISQPTVYRAADDIQVVKNDGVWSLRSYRT
ncbi:MAG: AAA family ATPase, partial [Armatimonadota bacterium]